MFTCFYFICCRLSFIVILLSLKLKRGKRKKQQQQRCFCTVQSFYQRLQTEHSFENLTCSVKQCVTGHIFEWGLFQRLALKRWVINKDCIIVVSSFMNCKDNVDIRSLATIKRKEEYVMRTKHRCSNFLRQSLTFFFYIQIINPKYQMKYMCFYIYLLYLSN